MSSDNERHDIFSPKYKERKQFFRKSNIYRMTIIILTLAVFIWGSRDYIYSYVTGLEIQDMRHQVVYRPMLTSSGYNGYFIINRASYDIRLTIECGAKNFSSSYNDTVLIPNQIIYIVFRGVTIQDSEIVIHGVKV